MMFENSAQRPVNPDEMPHISLKLAIVVNPFATRRNWIDGIPVLDNFAIRDSKEIIERNMPIIEVSLANA